jgi:hypothetical protein
MMDRNLYSGLIRLHIRQRVRELFGEMFEHD